MATNFKILIHRNSDNLHLKLMGDFDGSSAWELLHLLKKSANGVYKVIIHTGSLKQIDPFGRETFVENLPHWKVHPIRILFTGEKAGQIAPEESSCI
ncbi:MAG: hypothetical protein JRL30_30100 [Deltaproteobacteria bacterium]|nr:hypothetical protein [Deltaproteobacteria bacterium]